MDPAYPQSLVGPCLSALKKIVHEFYWESVIGLSINFRNDDPLEKEYWGTLLATVDAIILFTNDMGSSGEIC